MNFKYEPISLTCLKTQLTFVVGFYQTVNAIFTDWRVGVVFISLISLPVCGWYLTWPSGTSPAFVLNGNILVLLLYECTFVRWFVLERTRVVPTGCSEAFRTEGGGACQETSDRKCCFSIKSSQHHHRKHHRACYATGTTWQKHPSQVNVNMAESCEKIPRLKWPCVLQPLHVQSSTFDRNYLLGS